MNGVSRCIVGYSGGKEENPTYRNIKDHTEALLVEFDPKRCSYEDLVVEWSRMHTPSTRKAKCQYRSAVWYLTEEQKETCDEVVAGIKALHGKDVETTVEPATRFYRGEEYHQNFMAKQMGGGR